MNINKFCGNDALICNEAREWLRLPFRSGENLRAANGHICIEVDNTDQADVSDPPQNVVKEMDKWFAEDRPADDQWLTIPALPELEPCEQCGGNGISDSEDCSGCDGTGEQQQRIELGDTGFSIRYLRLLQSLPNARIAPNGMTRAPFEFDGGRGFLMPMRGR